MLSPSPPLTRPQLLATRNAEIESEIGAIVIRPSAATPAAAAVTAVDGGSPRLQPSQQLQRADATSDAADATQPIAASKALQRVMHECIAEFFAREGGSGGGGVSSSTGSGAAAAGAGLTSQERHDIRRAIIASLIDEETRRARLSSRELSELEAALAASLLDAAVAAASASASSQEGDGEGARGGTAALMPQRSTLTTASSTPQARSGASSGSGTLASSVRRLAGGIMRLRVGKPKPAAPAAAAPMGTVAAVPANDSVATAPPQSQPPPPAAAAAGSADRGETVDGVRGITPATTTAADGDDSRPPSSSPHAAADAARRPLGATNTPSFTTSSFKPVLTAARRVPPLLPVLPPLGEPLPPLATTAREGDMNGRADRKASAESDDGDDDGGVSPSALAAAEVAARAAHLRQQRDLLLAKKAAERQRALDEFQGRRRALAAQQQLPRHAADGSGSGGGGAGGTPNPLRAAVARL